MVRELRVAGLVFLLGTLCSPLAHAVKLDAAYQSALSYDADIKSARAARLESEEGVPVARSGLLPQVTYTLQRNKAATTNYQIGTGLSADTGSYFNGSSSLSLRQPLFKKAAWAALESAEAQSEAADANYQKEEQNLGLRVASTYLDVLLARAGLALANAETKAMEGQVVLAERSIAGGTGSRTDVDDALARRDMSRAKVLEARLRLSQASRDFRTVTDVDAALVPIIDPQALQGKPMALSGREEWLARIEAANPDIQSLRKQLEAAKAEVGRAMGGHYPTVDLVAVRQSGRSETNTTIGTGYNTNYVGFQISLPLVSGFGVMAQVRQTEAHVERVMQGLESTRRKVLAEADRLYLSVEHGIEKVEALKQAIVSTEQALISARKGVQAGTRTIVDVLDSERRLYETKRDQAFGVFELANNRLKFLAQANAVDGEAIKYVAAWLSSAER